MIFDSLNRALTVFGVTSVVTVGEAGFDFSQVAPSDQLAAQRAERLRAGRSTVHQNESHVAPPNAKQNTVSD